MAKRKDTADTARPKADVEPAVATTLTTLPLEQQIANRTGLGIGIVAELLKAADREAIAASIDRLSNEELLERLEPSQKA